MAAASPNATAQTPNPAASADRSESRPRPRHQATAPLRPAPPRPRVLAAALPALHGDRNGRRPAGSGRARLGQLRVSARPAPRRRCPAVPLAWPRPGRAGPLARGPGGSARAATGGPRRALLDAPPRGAAPFPARAASMVGVGRGAAASEPASKVAVPLGWRARLPGSASARRYRGAGAGERPCGLRGRRRWRSPLRVRGCRGPGARLAPARGGPGDGPAPSAAGLPRAAARRCGLSGPVSGLGIALGARRPSGAW